MAISHLLFNSSKPSLRMPAAPLSQTLHHGDHFWQEPGATPAGIEDSNSKPELNTAGKANKGGRFMQNSIAILAVAISLLLGVAGIAAAQDSTTTTQTTTSTTTSSDNGTNNHGDVRTLTGCLRQGDDAGEYQLLTQNGSKWELKSDAVNLSQHVGHTVAVTGAVANSSMHDMKEDAKKAASEHGMKASPEHGHLTVTDLNMVSSSCSQ
jgi:hypothetical protein